MFSGWSIPSSRNSRIEIEAENENQDGRPISAKSRKSSQGSEKYPQAKLLSNSSTIATTQIDPLNAAATYPLGSPTSASQSAPISPSLTAVTSPVISLSRPLSAHSILLDRVPQRLSSRSQSVKDGNLYSHYDGHRPSSKGSRQSLASTLTAHLFTTKQARSLEGRPTSQLVMSQETNSDAYSDASRLPGQFIIGERYSTSPTSAHDAMPPDIYINERDKSEEPGAAYDSPFGFTEQSPEHLASELDYSRSNSGLVSPVGNTNFLPEEVEEDGYLSEGDVINGPAHRRQYGNEDPSSAEWLAHKHQVFILSSAGKPIYTRYGDESKLSGYMGILQAIISFFADDNDSIRCINAGAAKIVFMLRDPLYFILVSKTSESEETLREQLYCFHHQILSILTASQLTRVFEKSTNFDLRRLLGGTECFLDALAMRISGVAPSHLLEAIRAVRLPFPLRSQLGKALKPVRDEGADILYVVLASRYRLVHLLRSQRVTLHPTDLHLLLNVVHASPSFMTSHQASWLPICLPRFNRNGFLYALIVFLSRDPPLALVLLSPHRDKFEAASKCQESILAALEQKNLLGQVIQAARDDEYNIVDVGVPGLRHFLFKSKPLVQFTASRFRPPYILNKERKRLFSLYQDCYYQLHNRFRPLRIHFTDTEQETVVGWHTQQFELYATFTPYISKAALVQSALKLTRWVQARREELFITQTTLL
ncbi:Vacuolar fusion protein mon1 [Entomophthora muscae]|uniref:Vacuolar fusion protein mon1 n=1 Tax=Entomophthora muscae TaxID=34485 RepID=A0ACC2S167_9FUNG|nr:Vacuolar fusion protein mon1 [Entomophthora muscae]